MTLKTLQEQLVQKHKRLQQQIRKQQEDLHLVSEQLAMLQRMEAAAAVAAEPVCAGLSSSRN
jgi:DNA repair exonuclease SbcCD ATPase subunit